MPGTGVIDAASKANTGEKAGPATESPASKPAIAPKQAPKKESRSDYDIKYEHDKKVRKVFRLRIVYNKKGCVASGHCVLSDPYDFELDEEFKAILKEGKEQPGKVPGIFIKEIETTEPHLAINAAKTCTPRVIAVIDMDTG
ncbi:MAG: hypothetical protein HY367_03255, partial [Candidatus Aenigmarchaeota archaeon]|nr:hypothetical protein [Candidatus Aenigmarchaeota archaeon]